jgi:hypothetical protein
LKILNKDQENRKEGFRRIKIKNKTNCTAYNKFVYAAPPFRRLGPGFAGAKPFLVIWYRADCLAMDQ